jgi:hypothetical protein
MARKPKNGRQWFTRDKPARYDITAPGFAAECRRQARIVNESDRRSDIMDFLMAIADWGDEENDSNHK